MSGVRSIFIWLAVIFISGAAVLILKPDYRPSLIYKTNSGYFKNIKADKFEDGIAAKADETVPEESRINFNTASAEELLSLEGISENMAEDLLIFRDEHGPFKTMSDIASFSRMNSRVFAVLERNVNFK